MSLQEGLVDAGRVEKAEEPVQVVLDQKATDYPTIPPKNLTFHRISVGDPSPRLTLTPIGRPSLDPGWLVILGWTPRFEGFLHRCFKSFSLFVIFTWYLVYQKIWQVHATPKKQTLFCLPYRPTRCPLESRSHQTYQCHSTRMAMAQTEPTHKANMVITGW